MTRQAARRRPLRLYLKRIAKELRFLAQPSATLPVFVFGQQRSGTTMLMSAFDWNDDCRVYEEGDRRVFRELRIPDLNRLADTVARSGARRNVYKPLCDSHRAGEFLRAFPDARCIWMFREPLGVSRSAMRRFPEAHLTLRAVCTGGTTGTWFEEGLSSEVRRTLVSVYRPALSARDCACLIWWARNRLAMEQQLAGRAWFVEYDELVRNARPGFQALFGYLDLELDQQSISFVHQNSSHVVEPVQIDADVTALCAPMLDDLRRCVARNAELTVSA